MGRPGDYKIKLLEVGGMFYNGIQVSAAGQARLGHVAKGDRADGYTHYYVDVREPEGTAIPWVPAGWERLIVRDLSAGTAH